MGAPSGHPFFGNQYTDGGYQTGTYTYVGEAVENFASIVKDVLKEDANNQYKASTTKVSSESMSKLSDIQESLSTSSLSGRDKIIIGGILVAVASIGGVITYKILKKKKSVKKDTIELENVGVCIDCGEPLIGSELHLENNGAYITCNNCGTKNYAHYDEKEEV